ncbi:MAG: [ribosomal protein S5]-alanine N-acetyltransferase [Acidobacteriota bacterium]|jgi:ribosomal-protein-alanine N-acetyltransferase|nr:[ribosomal protein S5]-alanine N-acetyltransferase [Acidobacteriota bacterium]
MNSGDKTRLKTAAIVGERVFLRPPTRSDLEEFISLNRASARLHRGLATPPTQPKQFDAFLKRCAQADCVCLLACRLDDGAIVGSVNLSQIFRGGFKNAYLGYHVGAEHANQRYMTEAIQLMLRYAFEHLKLHRLEANIQPGNAASIALVNRAGFVREGYSRRYLKISGRWRDHERWAILADDWRTRRKHGR